MTTTLAPRVRGTGFLAGYLARRLGRDAPDVLVAGLDELPAYHDLLVARMATGEPLLFVGTWRSMVYIGPRWEPGRPGCPHCLVTRTANSPFGPDLAAEALVAASVPDRSTWTLGPDVAALVACLVTAPRGDDVVVVDGLAGTVEPQVLLPDSTCATCGSAEADTLPRFTESPLPKLGPKVLRTARISADVVERDYLFTGIGLFKEVRQDLQSPIGACSVELSTRWGRREPAIGRSPGYAGSRAVAVLEGLERYAGLHRGGGRTAVRACYNQVADQALYPPSLGAHPESSYATEGFRYRRFDPDTVIDWVWAYSFRAQDRVLVPERSAFWGPRHDGEVSFAYETSNGCALGNSAEEAILHGLRELAERDSFLLTWYRKLALPEVELSGADPGLDNLLRKAALATGFRFRAFESTMEYGMPSFWLVAENTRADGPRVLAGAGAHPDPVQAVTGGLAELIGIVQATEHSFAERADDARRLFADPSLMHRMADHALVGALPEAYERFAFLLDGPGPARGLAEVLGTVRADAADLRADVDHAVTALLGAGLDVLVVDQTMPELSRNGLHCVRVIAPGLVPMTFGHRNRRTVGLPRLTGGDGLPGYPTRLDSGEEIGCVPHPFP